MCHHHVDHITELSEAEQEEVLENHSRQELEAELEEDELAALSA